MSKKMMKRSLALGALMAFVITGQAWAGEYTSRQQNKSITDDYIKVTVSNPQVHQAIRATSSNNVVINATNGNVELNSRVHSEGSASIAITASDSVVINSVSGGALVNDSTNGGSIALNAGNDITLKVTPSSESTRAQAINAAGDVVLSAGGNIVIEGDIRARTSTGNVEVSFNGAESYFKGHTTLWNNTGKINFAFNDGAVWYVEDDMLPGFGTSMYGDKANNKVTTIAGNGGKLVKSANSGDVTVTVTGLKDDSTTTNKNEASGTALKGNVSLDITGVDFVIDSEGTAIYNQNVDIDSDSDVTIKAKDDGITVYGKVDIDAANVTIDAVDDAIFIAADGDGGVPGRNYGEAKINATGNLKITSTKGYAVNNASTQEGVVEIVGQNVTLISEDRTAVKVGHTSGTVGYDGTVNIGDGTTETITIQGAAQEPEGGNERKGSAVYAQAGTLNLNASNSITITDTAKVGGNAIGVDGGALSVNSGSVDTVIVVDGNISQTSGAIDLALQNDKSYVIGTINTTTEDADITFGNGSVWNNTGESNVAKLTLDEGIINQTNSANKIQITELSGEGTLKVADITAGQVVVGNANGYALTVATETKEANTGETLSALSKVAITEDGDSAANKVQLKNALYDNVTATVNGLGNFTINEDSKVVAEANVAANDMVAVGLMSWRSEMNDMNKRMGELRNANGEHGVWVRMVRGESEYNSVKNQYNQYQLGYDEKLSVDKRWTVGVALSYTDAENNFAQGNGESTNKALSVYGSKLNADGTFVDLIAKYARLENEFDIVSGMGDADYSTNGYSFSAEFGKRIQQGKGLWIEPQVELTYGKISAVDYVTANGINVTQDGMESLVGRIGFSLGKDVKDGNIYARASYLYDFDGEAEAVLDGVETLKQDLGGGWWEVGVGANVNLSQATYIYADVEKTFGGEVDTNWQWNLGVRYSF